VKLAQADAALACTLQTTFIPAKIWGRLPARVQAMCLLTIVHIFSALKNQPPSQYTLRALPFVTSSSRPLRPPAASFMTIDRQQLSRWRGWRHLRWANIPSFH